jgi:hypothetical protein
MNPFASPEKTEWCYRPSQPDHSGQVDQRCKQAMDERSRSVPRRASGKRPGRDAATREIRGLPLPGLHMDLRLTHRLIPRTYALRPPTPGDGHSAALRNLDAASMSNNFPQASHRGRPPLPAPHHMRRGTAGTLGTEPCHPRVGSSEMPNGRQKDFGAQLTGLIGALQGGPRPSCTKGLDGMTRLGPHCM